jgi:3,4-dihydroxy 2-butanone 4-phosphate synthase/GTP cyclohydrolase II
VSVDAADGIESGISAADRAHTLRLLADPATTPAMVRRPGHVFPLRARAGGLTERRGHTEAAVELMRLCGLAPVAVISEVCNDDGSVARLSQLRVLADQHWLKVVSIEQIATVAL